MTAPAASEVELGSLLYTLPSPAGGRLCVTGTGISVRQISLLHNEGLSAAEIAAEYPGHLPIAGVHAAIAYYLSNKARLDAEYAEYDRKGRRLQAYYEKHGRFPEADSPLWS